MGFPSKLWFLYTFTKRNITCHCPCFSNLFFSKKPSFWTNFPPFFSDDQGTWKQPKPIRTRRRWYPASKVWTFRDDVRRCELSRWTKQKTQEFRCCWHFWCVFLLRMGSTILIRLFDVCVCLFSNLMVVDFGQLTWFFESPANYRGFKSKHDELKKNTAKEVQFHEMLVVYWPDLCKIRLYKPQTCI